MMDTAFTLLETLPDIQRGFFNAHVHYRFEIVSAAVFLMNRDEERSRAFLERVTARFPDELLGMLARLKLAQLDEDGDANLANLKRTYEELSDYPGEFRVWDTATRSEFTHYQALARIDTLTWGIGKVTAVITRPTLLRKYKRSDAPVKSLIPTGTVVQILYLYGQANIASQAAHPVKVELENGSAGWVDSAQINPRTN